MVGLVYREILIIEKINFSPNFVNFPKSIDLDNAQVVRTIGVSKYGRGAKYKPVK